MRTPRVRTPRIRTRSKLLALLAAASILATFSVASALAVHDDGLFELDTTSAAVCAPVPPPCGNANVADDPAVAGDDWTTLFNGGGSAFADTFIPDPVGSAENSFYTGGGSKDVRDIPDWAYGTTNDVVPDKDDLADAFAAAYTDSGNPAPNTDHTIIYFGVDRYDNNGDAETGFWFFKDTVELDGSGGFTGEHSIGDVLVLADWGGSNPVGAFTVYEWVGGKNPLSLVSDTAAGGADCAKIAIPDNACAVVNRAIVDPPWPFLDKGGSADIRPLELFEAGIDLTALFGEDQCFASFLASTRSSHSVTAQLKDFTLGQFEQCGAAIEIEGDATNEVGDEHTFTVTVSQSLGGSSSPVEGVFPEVTLTASNGADVDLITDNCADVGTDANGECTVTFTSEVAGVVTGHASVTVTIGEDTFPVETDGEGDNSDDAVKTFVDASIAIAPDDVNEVGESHTFTATAQVDMGDGNGLVDVPDGTVVTVTLTDENGSTVQTTTDDCASPGTVDGDCDVTFTSPTAGIVNGNASFSITVDGVQLTRDTTGTAGPGGSGDADKRFVDAYITIGPDEATNNVTDPHTFTVEVFQDTGDGNGFVHVPDLTIVTVTLTASDGAVVDLISDTCADPGTASGICEVTFTSATSGTVTGHAEVDLTLEGDDVHRETDGIAPNSGDAVKHFITGSLQILKNSTKGGAVATAGAVFSVDGDLLADDFEVTDNGTNDGDPDVGEICVGGVTPGADYTVNEITAPEGYGDATETDVIVTAVSGTCETADFSGEGNSAVFVNAPLFDFQVNFRDGGSGETSATSITCDLNSALDDPATDGWDASQTNLDVEFVDELNGDMTIVCTLVVDP